MLLEELEAAIRDASLEVMNFRISRSQLSEMVDRSQLILTATKLLSLTYTSSARELEEMMDAQLTNLPSGLGVLTLRMIWAIAPRNIL
ncbi:MAG: hypothetical protein EBE86_017945 [Hormoscilla sp. GUM202]|nr:hypothetical protein [Hormoscilla sp. GUM202]